MTWVMIVMSRVTSRSFGGGYHVYNVPGFTSQAPL
jgi:hypothetical protein